MAVDIVQAKVDMINNHKSPIQDDYIEKYLAEKELNLTATLDAKAAYSDADFVVIAAPTNYDSKTQHFDTSAVEAVIKLVMEYNPNAIMVIKSTIPVGYTASVREKFNSKNIIFSPEFLRDEDIPYTAQMIATITRQQIGTVERALQIFLKLGLVEVLDSGTFYMSNIELLIGQSSTEAERKRAARLQNKALSAPRTNGGHLSDIRPPEIEIELEKEIEIKREIEKGRSARAYGRYQNVFLTDEELADLQVSFPTVWEQYIEKLSEYMASTGKRYQSHAATIRRWAGEDAKKTVTPSRNRDYSVKEDETV